MHQTHPTISAELYSICPPGNADLRIGAFAFADGTFPLPAQLPYRRPQTGATQETPSAAVLIAEATKRIAMDPTPDNAVATTPSPAAAPAITDEQLMLACSHGSADAFTELFARYKQPLFGFFRRRVADPAQAEELTQETFLAVLRAASRYQPTALFRTYLYAIAFKILRAHRRKAAFRATFLGTATRSNEPASRNAHSHRNFAPRNHRQARSHRSRNSSSARIRATKLRRNCRATRFARQHCSLTTLPRPSRASRFASRSGAWIIRNTAH